jgi:hypothetical protein
VPRQWLIQICAKCVDCHGWRGCGRCLNEGWNSAECNVSVVYLSAGISKWGLQCSDDVEQQQGNWIQSSSGLSLKKYWDEGMTCLSQDIWGNFSISSSSPFGHIAEDCDICQKWAWISTRV